MTEDIAALEQQRNDLNQRIALAHQAARDVWNDGLDAIAEAVNRLADERGLEVDESGRKNVTTLAVGGVKVRYSYAAGEYSPYLSVEGGQARANFASQWAVPVPAVVVALVTALLDAEVTS